VREVRSNRRPTASETGTPRGPSAYCDGCGRLLALADLTGHGPLLCGCCAPVRRGRHVGKAAAHPSRRATS
jgi:hypothetical protein